MKYASLVNVAFVVALSSGCASITGTNSQSVSVQTREQSGKEVIAASCELTNNKGKWFVTTPGSLTIQRSNDDMQVLCNKPGSEPGRASVVSATKGSMFGNIIFGGGIGAVIDHNTGAAYEYPNFVQVVMGMFAKIDPPPSNVDQPANSSSPQTSAPAMQPVSSLSSPQAANLEEKLRELKRLFESGLITQDAYVDRQKALLADSQCKRVADQVVC